MLLEYIQTRMVLLCPNMCALIGAPLATYERAIRKRQADRQMLDAEKGIRRVLRRL